MRTLIAVIGIVLLGTGMVSAQESKPLRYPNELQDYEFYRTAKWNSLEPLVSTMDNVRKVMGRPDEANDNAAYTRPYPGDAAAQEPVFRYRLSRQWDVLFYFATSCPWKLHPDVPRNRLCSIDLIPRKRVSFRAVHFSPVFAKRHVTAVDAAWDEYSDGTGLRYEIYTTKPPYGVEIPGDLDRISYGPGDSELIRGD